MLIITYHVEGDFLVVRRLPGDVWTQHVPTDLLYAWKHCKAYITVAWHSRFLNNKIRSANNLKPLWINLWHPGPQAKKTTRTFQKKGWGQRYTVCTGVKHEVIFCWIISGKLEAHGHEHWVSKCKGPVDCAVGVQLLYTTVFIRRSLLHLSECPYDGPE